MAAILSRPQCVKGPLPIPTHSIFKIHHYSIWYYTNLSHDHQHWGHLIDKISKLNSEQEIFFCKHPLRSLKSKNILSIIWILSFLISGTNSSIISIYRLGEMINWCVFISLYYLQVPSTLQANRTSAPSWQQKWAKDSIVGNHLITNLPINRVI